MSKAAILDSIRRNLRRGPLPEDVNGMLRARLDAHPRHLITIRGVGFRLDP